MMLAHAKAPNGNDHFLGLVRDHLYRPGPSGREGTSTPALVSLDTAVGDAVGDIMALYERPGEDEEAWLDAASDSIREEAMDAVIAAMAKELQLWLAARAAKDLSVSGQ